MPKNTDIRRNGTSYKPVLLKCRKAKVQIIKACHGFCSIQGTKSHQNTLQKSTTRDLAIHACNFS